jgi:diguanylate cyclase (GGDEF)-like protein
LIRGGDLYNASFTYVAAVQQLFDCAPVLSEHVKELESGLEFAARTGNEVLIEWLAPYQRLTRQLRGEGAGPEQADTLPVEASTSMPPAVAVAYIVRGMGAAIFGDSAALERQTAAATPLPHEIEALFPAAQAHLLRALALGGLCRAAAPAQRGPLLAEFDEVITWLAARAADAPVNFLHLLRLAEAERAWAVDDFRAAAYAFDAAQHETSGRQRPWHRALIRERAARFHLAYGMQHAGYTLLAEARRDYLDWGATAKVSQLDWAYPTVHAAPETTTPLTTTPLTTTPPTTTPETTTPRTTTPETTTLETDTAEPGELPTRPSTISTGNIDLLAILAASQALSSETGIDGLHTRVVKVLSAMTGATDVHLLLWNDDRHNWTVSTGNGATTPLDDTSQQHLLPLSVIRYAERTREPMIVNDATHDDRFADDPYLTGLDSCSLLAVPIFIRGTLKAMLLLENRLIRGAFSTERLDGVMLIAGQLAVSLENAQVYASLEHKVAERTHQLALANQRLEQLSATDPLTGLANRRHLQQVLQAQWHSAQRRSAPLAFAMVDIDHFKLYNDHFGHPAGDECLRRVATQLSHGLRHTDLAARYGGEEFAIVMPDTDIHTATTIAEHLRASVEALAEPNPLNTGQFITVSIGVAATIPTPDDATQQLIQQADAGLYRAKRTGRNRVRNSHPNGPAPEAGSEPARA